MISAIRPTTVSAKSARPSCFYMTQELKMCFTALNVKNHQSSMKTVIQCAQVMASQLAKHKFFIIWLFPRNVCSLLDRVAKRGLSVEEMLKLRCKWQESQSQSDVGRKKVYLMVEVELTDPKRKKKAMQLENRQGQESRDKRRKELNSANQVWV